MRVRYRLVTYTTNPTAEHQDMGAYSTSCGTRDNGRCCLPASGGHKRTSTKRSIM